MRKADNLTPSCAIVTKSGNRNFLEPSGPVQACKGTDLPFYLNPMDALPSCSRPSLILYSHLSHICPSGPILSKIPTKTVSAFPSCFMHATFHTKEICLDFFIPLNMNDNFNHEFRHCGILFSILLLPSYWVHTSSSVSYS